jgi:hypothetical protein
MPRYPAGPINAHGWPSYGLEFRPHLRVRGISGFGSRAAQTHPLKRCASPDKNWRKEKVLVDDSRILSPWSRPMPTIQAAWRTGDVMAAGQHCGVALTPHVIVLKRTAERMTAIDQTIAEAIDAGVLKSFNAAYRARRMGAKRHGRPFMSYSQALAKLRAVIAKSVANGGEIPPAIRARSQRTPRAGQRRLSGSPSTAAKHDRPER